MQLPVDDKNVIAVCKLIKIERTLAVGEVSLHSLAEPVAHVVGTSTTAHAEGGVGRPVSQAKKAMLSTEADQFYWG